ncbi:MAG: fibro-slime domain-containing protein [Planctomycetota bacterium]
MTRLSHLAKITAAASLALPAGLAFADGDAPTSLALTGKIRDFQMSHPDMQNPNKSFGVKTGLVTADLCEEGLPVLDTSLDYTRGMISGQESFDQWFRDVEGVNVSFPHAIVLEPHPSKPGVYWFAREKGMSDGQQYFFPADGKGYMDHQVTSMGDHNYYFTYELRTSFNYSDPASRDQALEFSFTGDDDVWVYINGKLAVDLGGVHGQAHGSVNLDEQAEALGLEAGGNYELVLFFAERHTTESNFRVETTLELEEVLPTSVSPLFD